MAQYTISIIIPVLNEAKIIKPALDRLARYSEVEVIVVDGGSQDETVAIARSLAEIIILESGGRAAQMNAGAKRASADILLFLHADTQLPDNFVDLVCQTLKSNRIIAGAFALKIGGRGRALRIVELLVKLRSRLFSLPYGDQAIFITKDNFDKAGGFAELPIMEDFEFVKRVKQLGKIAIVPATVTTSGRRWQKLGVWQTTLTNQLVILGYYLGVSPTKLARFYRSRGRKDKGTRGRGD